MFGGFMLLQVELFRVKNWFGCMDPSDCTLAPLPVDLSEYLPLPHCTHFNPEDGGSIFLRNVSICVQDSRVSQCRGSTV